MYKSVWCRSPQEAPRKPPGSPQKGLKKPPDIPQDLRKPLGSPKEAAGSLKKPPESQQEAPRKPPTKNDMTSQIDRVIETWEAT